MLENTKSKTQSRSDLGFRYIKTIIRGVFSEDDNRCVVTE
jgi:hypothetical protein